MVKQKVEGESSIKPEERKPLAQVRFQDVLINLDYDDNPKDYFNLIIPVDEKGNIISHQRMLLNIIEEGDLFGFLYNNLERIQKIEYLWNKFKAQNQSWDSINLCFIYCIPESNRKFENLFAGLKNSGIIENGMWIPVAGFSYGNNTLIEILKPIIEIVKISLNDDRTKYGQTPITIAIPKDLSEGQTKQLFNIFVSEFAKSPEETVDKEEFSQSIEPDSVKTKTPSPADHVPTHYDKAEDVDRLNRKPLARSLAALIKGIWDVKHVSKEYGESFMVHVQGQWGSGKSTFLNLFRQELNASEKWIIIEYNAWQNQHINPPWWTFLSSVYKQSRKQLGFWGKIKLRLTENWRRFWIGNIVSGVTSLSVLVLTGYMVYLFLPVIFPDASDPKKTDPEKYLITLTTLTGIVLTLLSFSKTLSSSLLPGSVKTAESFLNLSKDPMQKVKRHFGKLIKTINYPVALFIDDLDRCNPKFTVEFLEGIQTLFRSTKVLYVVAADRKWLAKCFEIHYEDFAGDFDKKGSRLGYLFIHKAFQLSLRMPILSVDQKEKYWEFILHPDFLKAKKKAG